MATSKLLHGDCLEYMSSIPNKSIDCIIVDPPYNISYTMWDVFENMNKVFNEFERILKHNGSLFIFSGWSFVVNIITTMPKTF
jgi:DNA modification methylase